MCLFTLLFKNDAAPRTTHAHSSFPTHQNKTDYMEAMEAENEAAAMEFKRNYHRANQQAQHLREVSRLGSGGACLAGRCWREGQRAMVRTRTRSIMRPLPLESTSPATIPTA